MHHASRALLRIVGLGLASIALVTIFPACDGGNDDALPLDQFETRYTQAYCERVVECNFGGLGTLVDNDVDACATLLGSTNMSSLNLPDIVLSINAGYIQYDGARAQSCLNTLASSTCEELSTTGPAGTACEDMLTGLLEQDEDCTMDEECAGRWCDTRQQCPGHCTLTVLIGGTCANNARCEPGAYCDGSEYCASTSVRVPVGEPCGTYTPRCEYGLWCNHTSQECEVLGAVGAYCDSAAACLNGLFCDEEDGRCAEISVVNTDGEDCDPTAGVYCNLALGLTCASTTTDSVVSQYCTPFAQEGEYCDHYDQSTGIHTQISCDPYSDVYCAWDEDTNTSSCLAKLPVGQTCYHNGMCLSGNCPTGTCAPDPNNCQ